MANFETVPLAGLKPRLPELMPLVEDYTEKLGKLDYDQGRSAVRRPLEAAILYSGSNGHRGG